MTRPRSEPDAESSPPPPQVAHSGPPGVPIPPPKKKKTGLIVGFVVGGLVLVLLCTVGAVGAVRGLILMSPSRPELQFHGDYSVHDDEACAELSLDDYEAAVGEYTVTDSTFTELTLSTHARLHCNYDVPADDDFYLLQINAEAHETASQAEDSFEDSFEHVDLDAGGNWTLEPHAGLGESSHWKFLGDPDDVNAAMVRVWDDNLHLKVRLVPGDEFDWETAQTVVSTTAAEVMTVLKEEE